MLKVAVFRYLFWAVLVLVFAAGAARISIFGLGYLLACFYLLLFGTTLLQKDTRARLVPWDCLILYNVTVIISKNMLSLLSCVFVEQMQSSFCWVIQLFSLVCTVKGYYNRECVRAWGPWAHRGGTRASPGPAPPPSHSQGDAEQGQGLPAARGRGRRPLGQRLLPVAAAAAPRLP